MKTNPSALPATPRTSGRSAGDALAEREIPRIDSTVLLGSTGRVVIEHHGQRYELRETRYGKLILTK